MDGTAGVSLLVFVGGARWAVESTQRPVVEKGPPVNFRGTWGPRRRGPILKRLGKGGGFSGQGVQVIGGEGYRLRGRG